MECAELSAVCQPGASIKTDHNQLECAELSAVCHSPSLGARGSRSRSSRLGSSRSRPRPRRPTGSLGAKGSRSRSPSLGARGSRSRSSRLGSAIGLAGHDLSDATGYEQCTGFEVLILFLKRSPKLWQRPVASHVAAPAPCRTAKRKRRDHQ